MFSYGLPQLANIDFLVAELSLIDYSAGDDEVERSHPADLSFTRETKASHEGGVDDGRPQNDFPPCCPEVEHDAGMSR
jgi:hypothetical protein